MCHFRHMGGVHSFSRKDATSGPGLAIVRRLMAVHRGRIRATGQPGFGMTFTVHFPY